MAKTHETILRSRQYEGHWRGYKEVEKYYGNDYGYL